MLSLKIITTYKIKLILYITPPFYVEWFFLDFLHQLYVMGICEEESLKIDKDMFIT